MIQRPQLVPVEKPSTVACCVTDFLSYDFPEREHIIYPYLQTQGSLLVYAWRGTGKTQWGVGTAVSVATGTAFLKSNAPKPRKVCYVDGELPGALFQARIKEAMGRLPGNATLERDYLRVVTPDLQEGVMPNLSTPDGQREIEDLLGDTELLVLDTISTLFRTGDDTNQERSWVEAQEWILNLRRHGVSTMLVHHSSKNGTQRGTSKKEDIVDASISLRWPHDYSPEDGCRFECRLEKARNVFGADAVPYEAWLKGDVWSVKDLDDIRLGQVQEMKESGMSLGQIADATGIPKTTVHRLLKKGGGDER